MAKRGKAAWIPTVGDRVTPRSAALRDGVIRGLSVDGAVATVDWNSCARWYRENQRYTSDVKVRYLRRSEAN